MLRFRRLCRAFRAVISRLYAQPRCYAHAAAAFMLRRRRRCHYADAFDYGADISYAMLL